MKLKFGRNQITTEMDGSKNEKIQDWMIDLKQVIYNSFKYFGLKFSNLNATLEILFLFPFFVENFFLVNKEYYKLQNTGSSTSFTESRATKAHYIINQRLQNNRRGGNKNSIQHNRGRTQLG